MAVEHDTGNGTHTRSNIGIEYAWDQHIHNDDDDDKNRKQ